MKEHHPDQEALLRFHRGDLAPEDERETERHLSRCATCRERADEVEMLARLDLLESWLHPGYDEAIERAADRVSARLTDLLGEVRDAEVLFPELLRQPAPERRALIRRDQRFHSVKLCQLLEARSREMWSSDPAAAVEFAELAVEVAVRLDDSLYGSDLVEDAKATAWGYLANSHRVSADLWRAEQVLQRAWVHHVQAGEDPQTEAELLSFLASLRSSQGRFGQSCRILDRVIAIHREAQDRFMEGRALIQKGMSLGYDGRWEEAIRRIGEGLRRADTESDPALALMGEHNLICTYVQAGLPEQAWSRLIRKRPLYVEHGDRLQRVRLRWVEGILQRDLYDFGAAEAALREAREAFLDYGLGIDAAFASLDLMLLYTKKGCRLAVRDLAEEAIPFFDYYRLTRESLAARLLYEGATHL